MDEGWLKLHRKARHSAVFAEPPLWHFWCYLLIEANYAKRQLPDGTTLEPGQLVRGYRRMADDLHWSKGKVERRLRQLVRLGNITIETRSGTLAQVITICNWETYQGLEGLERDTSGDTSGTQEGRKKDTSGDKKKKGRREEGKKGRKTLCEIPPKLTDVEAYCRKRNNGIDPEAFMAHYGKQGWKLGNGNQMKDWRLAVITWEKNQKNDQRQPKLFPPSQRHDPERPVTAV